MFIYWVASRISNKDRNKKKNNFIGVAYIIDIKLQITPSVQILIKVSIKLYPMILAKTVFS